MDNVFLTEGRKTETTESFQLFSSVSQAVVTSDRMSVSHSAALMRYSGEIKESERSSELNHHTAVPQSTLTGSAHHHYQHAPLISISHHSLAWSNDD